MAGIVGTEKQALINKALRDPLYFSDKDFDTLVSLQGDDELTFDDIREMIKRIYSINDSILLTDSSEAYKGILGTLNKWSTNDRIKLFNERIKKKPDGKRKNILAEGDSWFQLPVCVNDIIGWLLQKNPDYAIYSIAYGGNWITNIIYDGNYVADLPILDPDYFLISGGGNDLVGDNRVAIMVHMDTDLKGREKKVPPEHMEASAHVTKEFFAFVITIKLQYYMMFRNIAKVFKDTTILTQGYDHAIPSYARRWSWRYPQQYLVNTFTDTGCWLKRPLEIKKVPDKMQRPIIRFFIDAINEMYISLAQSRVFPELYHIDARGVAQGHEDWFDELHLKPYKFEVVANAYQKFINGDIETEQPQLWQEIQRDRTFKATDVKFK